VRGSSKELKEPEQVPGQPEIYRETLSLEQPKKKI
jgi:hypothetical protein